MPQVTGIVKIYSNGQLQRTIENSPKLNMGGPEREMVTGHSVYGLKTTKIVPGSVSFEIAHTSDIDLEELRDLTDATLRYECDTGVTYMIANAGTTKTLELADGKVSVTIEGDPAVQE